jgi:putative salt-induced outer membrane protein YdiY
MMKKAFLILVFCSFDTVAQPDIMGSLYASEAPKYIVEQDENLSMTGELGMVFAEGNTNTSTLIAKLNAGQELKTWSYQVLADILYKQSKQEINGEQQKSTSAQKLFISSQFDYKLSKAKHRLFLYGEYEDNRFSNYRFQAALAAGWSDRMWHDEISEFKYSLGPGYAVSEANDSRLEKGLIVRAALEYKRKFSETATFRQFLSTETEQSFTKTKSETSLSSKISGALAMKLSFMMNLNKSQDTSRKELDTETSVSLVYQFF